ncbi:hypothetical protein QJQ45_002173 [Haematococcus lacustris]|nr:hypothetical protein QJQ45_002173 [Haematococcus lacustris]
MSLSNNVHHKARAQSPGLNIRSVWWSTKLAPAEEPAAASSGNDALPANPLTVVTMATLHRLSNLEAQCNSWPGPLTAAVYVPLLLGNDTGNSAILKEAQAAARKLYDRMERNPSACALRLLLVTELLGEAAALLLFPINSLRNVALLASDTPMVAMIDVDLLLSSSLASDLHGARQAPSSMSMEAMTALVAFSMLRAIWPEFHWALQPRDWCLLDLARSASEVMQLCREGNLLILPAFEICPDRTYQLQTGKQVADAAAKGGKAKLVKLVKEEKMCSFHAVYPEGHGPTQYPTWYKSTWPYKITHKPLFEPWFIVDRRLNPWYDARFRGYGYNKQEQVTAAAHAYNLTFLVHPAAYVVHRPHETTHVSRLWHAVKGPSVESQARVTKAMASMQDSAMLADHEPAASKLSNVEVAIINKRMVKALMAASLQRMEEGVRRTDRLDPPVHDCLSELPWWQAPPAGEGDSHS